MSWPTQPKVRLAVTRFSPEQPVAGLTAQQRAAHRQKREAECAKVEPAIDLDADIGFDEPEERYGDPRRDFADSVGIPLYERFRL